ncbi:hypothetical protein [Oceanihabitans sediminis]|uniref:hypothetical protein n=1 Tax=Oceanihabitans sediminis TaxID=1812012 RepID=UPI003A8D82E9
MKKLLILLFISISQIAFCQLGKSKSELFEKESSDYYTKDVQENFTVYSYIGKTSKLNGDECNELVSYFINNETESCFQVTYASCAGAANNYVKFFNKVAVQTKPNEWKDYSNNSIYTLTVENNISYVEHYYDSQNIIQNNNVDNVTYLQKVKTAFTKYISVRLQKIDETGYAYEKEDEREFHIGDINLDGVPDVIVLYTIKDVGGTNSSYRNILLLPNTDNEISNLYHDMVYGTLSGDGNFIGIIDGYAVFDIIKYPSKHEKIGYGIRNKNMVKDKIKE